MLRVNKYLGYEEIVYAILLIGLLGEIIFYPWWFLSFIRLSMADNNCKFTHIINLILLYDHNILKHYKSNITFDRDISAHANANCKEGLTN